MDSIVKGESMKDKYQFDWCEECDLLMGCYYQHNEYNGSPMFLEPNCAKGAYREKRKDWKDKIIKKGETE